MSSKINILYFVPRFSLVKEHLIEFNQLAMANSEGSDNMLNRVMPKDNIGLAALIKTKEAAWENGSYCLYITPNKYTLSNSAMKPTKVSKDLSMQSSTALTAASYRSASGNQNNIGCSFSPKS